MASVVIPPVDVAKPEDAIARLRGRRFEGGKRETGHLRRTHHHFDEGGAGEG
jgi:hypothetical protein